jgi:hypothetical protein
MPTRLRSSSLLALVLCCLFAGAAPASASLTVGNGIQLAPAESGAASSECPQGLESRQGGFSAGFGAEGGAEVSGFKIRGRGWRLLATNTGTKNASLSVESYCSPAAPHPIVRRSTTVRVPPLGAGAAVARCRRGETLLSAGFRNSIERGGPHVVVDGMRRVGVRNLRVTGANLSVVSAGRLTAYAYCGHARRPLVRTQSEAVPPGGKVRLVARCPEKARGFGFRTDLFGGFQAGPADPSTGAVSSPAQFRSTGDRIVVTAVNRDLTAPMQMTAFVYCR